jgi:hypothetical protein
VVGSSHRIGDSYSSEDPRNHIFEFTARRTLTPRITRSPLRRHSKDEGTRLLAQREKQRRRCTTGVVRRMGKEREAHRQGALEWDGEEDMEMWNVWAMGEADRVKVDTSGIRMR